MENDDFLTISGIQNFAYCKRRWALVHIEQMWNENALTLEGQYMHERVHDEGFTEKRGNKILSRGMAVSSQKYRINGICDMVELERSDMGISIYGREGKYLVYPVEYKHGKPNDGHTDELQLCAQAICLEEMLCTDIPVGAIYYGEIRHRREVVLTKDLRDEVIGMIAEMHQYMDRGYTPKVKRKGSCSNCSMMDYCFSQLLSKKSAKAYIDNVIKEEDDA